MGQSVTNMSSRVKTSLLLLLLGLWLFSGTSEYAIMRREDLYLFKEIIVHLERTYICSGRKIMIFTCILLYIQATSLFLSRN